MLSFGAVEEPHFGNTGPLAIGLSLLCAVQAAGKFTGKVPFPSQETPTKIDNSARCDNMAMSFSNGNTVITPFQAYLILQEAP